MTTMVDVLAQRLSELTGTKFTIRRGRHTERFPWGVETGPMLYQLRAEREGISYTFQLNRPMPMAEMRRWLASICDMVNMGFIRVEKKREGS
jgi:hypothetical protein